MDTQDQLQQSIIDSLLQLDEYRLKQIASIAINLTLTESSASKAYYHQLEQRVKNKFDGR